jgi:hypothetical protein
MCPVSITANIPLDDGATGGRTSAVGEPTAAASGDKILVTGNVFASRSTDAGTTWQHVDPFTTFPSVAGGFCCDQIVLHDPDRGLWIWILQYRQNNGTNVFRLAAAPDADFGNSAAWHWWDIGPADLDVAWSQLWFDYPDAAITTTSLHITFNVFNSADEWQRAVVMRFALDDVARNQPIGFEYWSTHRNGSLRLTQGAGSTMYWADQNSLAQIRLFSWADGQSTISWWDIDITPFSSTISSDAPNRKNWLSRADQRITGACLARGTITLAWTAGRHDPDRPHAYCRVVQIQEDSKQLIGEPDIYSPSHAWAYPAVCGNSAGVLGFTAFLGGSDLHPSHAVGVLEDNGAWSAVLSQAGTHSPAESVWGDYLSCRTDSGDPGTWVASGYVLEGGDHRTDIVPRVVRFTRVP